MHLTDEQRALGRDNFYAVVGSGLNRRDFLLGAAGAVAGGATLGGYYFGYSKVDNPVRVGIIGTGDEGNVLIGALNPDYINVVAISDIRPYNIHRAFHGDFEAPGPRPGLMKKYGWKSEDEARSHVKVYDKDYRDLLADRDVEGVIIALPLWLHCQAAIEAMYAGKHVLTEKLMAHTIGQCKEMARISQKLDMLLATGHQRHYSILYDNAVEAIRSNMYGQIHHIRAQWHRSTDSWMAKMPPDAVKELDEFRVKLAEAEKKNDMKRIEDVKKKIRGLEARALDGGLTDEIAASYGYLEHKVADAAGKTYTCGPLEELFRWRLWNRTGGGLMAELGSHQLDASSIFISAEWARATGNRTKVMPLAVTGVGGRHYYPLDREVDDHVYCSFEFPAPGYYKENNPSLQLVDDTNKRIVVTYSSINGNGYGGYGEVVMGDKGTLILDKEQEVLTFMGSNTAATVKVEKGKGLVNSSESPSGDVAVGKGALDLAGAPPSRGYQEEIEHWAWCIRNRSAENVPRCHPSVAMADAIIALTSNIAMREQRRVEFEPAWFDIESDATPDGSKPDIDRWKPQTPEAT